MVWSVGALPKRRILVHAVRDRVFFWLDLQAFGRESGLHLLVLLSLLLRFWLGLLMLGSWLSGLPVWDPYAGERIFC